MSSLLYILQLLGHILISTLNITAIVFCSY